MGMTAKDFGDFQQVPRVIRNAAGIVTGIYFPDSRLLRRMDSETGVLEPDPRAVRDVGSNNAVEEALAEKKVPDA